MSECRHLKPCQHIGRADRVCGKTPTIKITEFEYEPTGPNSFLEKIAGIKYFCIDHITSPDRYSDLGDALSNRSKVRLGDE